jgi:hypothetical protein
MSDLELQDDNPTILSLELNNNNTTRHQVYVVIMEESSEDLDSAGNPLVKQ